jgi:hypothetical protein
MGLLVTPASADHNFTFTQANTTFDATDSNGRFTGRAVTNPGHTQYTLYGSCSFRVVNNGNANLRFSFHYSMFCGPCGLPRSDPGRNELSTSFEIKYAA